MGKITKYLYRIVRSFFWDLLIFFELKLKNKYSHETYESYKASFLYPEYMKIGKASEVIESYALNYCTGRGLDIGAGKWPLKNSRGIEDNKDENAYKILEENESQDFVFSSHALEHLDNPDVALKEWVRVLKKEGVLFIYCPHPACNMWKKNIFHHHKWDIYPEDLIKKIEDIPNMSVFNSSKIPDIYFSFFVIAKKS